MKLEPNIVLETAFGFRTLDQQLASGVWQIRNLKPNKMFGLKIVERVSGDSGSGALARFKNEGWSKHNFQVVDAAQLLASFNYRYFEEQIPGTSCWIRGKFDRGPDPELERLLLEEEEIERRQRERREPF